MIQTLADALADRGYDELTQVQLAVTEDGLEGRDLLVSAQTGSGKTVGFGLAIAPTLLGDATRFQSPGAPLALVIAPTRELALQVSRELNWLYAKAGAVIATCVGGMDARTERRALDRGTHIVVATPGRLRDHIERNNFQTHSLKAVVLDEADEMLDLGFREDLEFILEETPEDRRTLMFSATVPRQIANLAKSYQRDAARVTTVAETKQHTDIEYHAMNVAPRDAENAVINVLRYHEAPTALVFCNTRAVVNRLTTRFSNRGFSVVALSGELTQSERTHALQAMRDGRARVCIATDVAARGIDLPNLELVVHAELPNNSATLLHRSGRTGRAGRKGISTLIVPAKMQRKAERLLQGAKVQAKWMAPPSADEVLARDEERLLSDPMWSQEITSDEAGFVAKLTEKFSAEQIAAAFMRLNNSKQSAPEELSKGRPEASPRSKDNFGPSVWFSISKGRDQNAEPRWILPSLCRAGDITNADIGAIRVQVNETYVQILQSSVDGFVAALGPKMELERGATLTRLDGEPKLERIERHVTKKPPRPRKTVREKREERAPRPKAQRFDASAEAKQDSGWPPKGGDAGLPDGGDGGSPKSAKGKKLKNRAARRAKADGQSGPERKQDAHGSKKKPHRKGGQSGPSGKPKRPKNRD